MGVDSKDTPPYTASTAQTVRSVSVGSISFWERQFGERQFAEGQFAEGRFGERQFGEGQFGEHQFGEHQFGEGQFGERQFGEGQLGKHQFAEGPFAEGQFGEGQFWGASVWGGSVWRVSVGRSSSICFSTAMYPMVHSQVFREPLGTITLSAWVFVASLAIFCCYNTMANSLAIEHYCVLSNGRLYSMNVLNSGFYDILYMQVQFLVLCTLDKLLFSGMLVNTAGAINF